MIDVDVSIEGCSLRKLVARALRHCETREITSLLYDREVVVSTAAARELQIRGGREALNVARKMLSEKLPGPRELGAFILGRLGTPQCPLQEKIIALLISALSTETNAQVRAVLIASIGQRQDHKALKEVFHFANDGSPAVRAGVALAIQFAADVATSTPEAKAIVEKLGRDQSRVVRAYAVRARQGTSPQ